MKVKYECGCEFDSNKKEDRAWSKYFWPDKCPRHKQSMHQENCRAVKIISPEANFIYSMTNSSSYYFAGTTA